MNDLNFSDYVVEMMRLYESEAYGEAYAWVMKHAGLFPAHRARIYFWRICLATRMNDMPLALNIMEEGLAAGHWYDSVQLRQDSDLAPLQGLPEFERMVSLSQQRQAEAQALIEPGLITVAPEAPHPPFPLLLVLHGGGVEDARFYETFFDRWRPALGMGWLLAAPQSSQLSGPGRRGWSDNARSAHEVKQHLNSLTAQYAIDSARIVVGGFSRGAELAAYLVLSGSIPARGFIAVAPGGPFTAEPGRWQTVVNGPSGRGRGYLMVGEQDEMALRGARGLKAALESNHIACAIEVHPNLKHEFPPDFDARLSRALEFILEN